MLYEVTKPPKEVQPTWVQSLWRRPVPAPALCHPLEDGYVSQ